MPYAPNEIEPMFEPQRQAAAERGFECSFLSYEDLQQEQRLVVRPAADQDDLLVLRGWMFKPAEYEDLLERGQRRNWKFLTSAAEYRRCHWMDGWYEQLKDFTSETVFLQERADIESLLTRWGRAFVKDRVKSCTVNGLPIVSNWTELEALQATMVEFRGEIEGGLCFRQVEEFVPESECRLFAFQGQLHHRPIAPEAVALARAVVERIEAPFYSIDLGLRQDGVWRVIELGDGQVSDLKEWPAEELFAIFPRGG